MNSSAQSTPSLEELLEEIVPKDGQLPPVHLWEPKACTDIDMEIGADGSWWHEGRRIPRQRLVRLFSTILRKDDDGFTYLVTPYEKVIVHVADAPFMAVRLDRVGAPGRQQALAFTTNVGDVTIAGPDAALRVVTDPDTLEPAPYVHVRGRLEAKLTRPVFYELAELAEAGPDSGGATLGVWSRGIFFPIGPAGQD